MRVRIAKILAVVLAMVMCMGMTAMAAPSPQGGVVTGVTKAVDKNGNDISGKIILQDVSKSFQSTANRLYTSEGLKEALGEDWNENLVVLDVKDVVYTGNDELSFPITVTFKVKGITASSKVIVLQWDAEQNKWVKLEVSVGDGTVTVTLNSLSPIAFIVDKTTVSEGVVSNTSPKTSASSASVIALVGLGAAVLAISLKKKSVLR